VLVGDASIPVAGGTRDDRGQIGRVVAPAASTAADILRGRFLKQWVPAGQLAGPGLLRWPTTTPPRDLGQGLHQQHPLCQRAGERCLAARLSGQV